MVQSMIFSRVHDIGLSTDHGTTAESSRRTASCRGLLYRVVRSASRPRTGNSGQSGRCVVVVPGYNEDSHGEGGLRCVQPRGTNHRRGRRVEGRHRQAAAAAGRGVRIPIKGNGPASRPIRNATGNNFIVDAMDNTGLKRARLISRRGLEWSSGRSNPGTQAATRVRLATPLSRLASDLTDARSRPDERIRAHARSPAEFIYLLPNGFRLRPRRHWPSSRRYNWPSSG